MNETAEQTQNGHAQSQEPAPQSEPTQSAERSTKGRNTAATTTQAGRIPLDAYDSAVGLVDILLDQPDLDIRGTVIECCAGAGAISNRVWERRLQYQPQSRMIACDISPRFSPCHAWDATQESDWQALIAEHSPGNPTQPDWVITNPSFTIAHQVLPLALKYSPQVAFLLRLSYLEPAQNRYHWLVANADQMTAVIPVCPRPSFRLDNTGKPGRDSVTVAWYVWNANWSWRKLGILPPFRFAGEWNRP